MMKVLIGLAAVVVVAAAGLLGFNLYVQHRVAAAIEAPFDQLRAAGGKASHGKVTVDLLTRTVTVVDISVSSATQPPFHFKIASLTASGARRSDPARVSADSVELTGVELTAEATGNAQAQVAYEIPRLTVKDYAGPADPAAVPALPSLVDIYRFSLEQLSTMTASSVVIPSATGTINGGPSMAGGGEFAYSGLAMQDIRDGKIANLKFDGLSFRLQSERRDEQTGNLANFTGHDFDAAAAAAILNPAMSTDDSYHRIYRQLSAGPYVVNTNQGVQVHIDAITVEDIALRPSKLQLSAFLAVLPQGAAPPSQDEARTILEKAANIYEGIRIGKAELRGNTVQTPTGPFTLAALRASLESGRGPLALENLEVATPKGPIRFDRFALNSFDIAQLMRFVARSAGGPRVTSDDVFGALGIVDGIEVKGAATPFRNTNRLVNIETIDLGWGQFIGPVPSKAHLVAKLDVPVDLTDPMMKPLADGGIDRAAINLELGAGWSEESGSVVLAPATLEIGKVLKASVRASFANVPRGLFSPDWAEAANQVETGTIEFSLRDNGGVDLALAQYAFANSVSIEAARRAMTEQIKALGEALVSANPDAAALVDAAVRFVETPRQTLFVKLTPRAKMALPEFVDVLNMSPLNALAPFHVEASTGL